MHPEGPGPLTEATQDWLKSERVADSALAAVALALAGRIDVAVARGESGSSLAALSREFRATLRALAGAGPVAADPLDQLRACRAARLRAWPPSPPAC
jgi:hypothetical protein